MKDLSATDAARRFSEVLDSVEHGRESFRVLRGGRPVARIVPVGGANGLVVAQLLASHPSDPTLEEDIRAMRSVLRQEESGWRD